MMRNTCISHQEESELDNQRVVASTKQHSYTGIGRRFETINEFAHDLLLRSKDLQ